MMFSMMTFNIMTFSIMTFNISPFSKTIIIIIQHNDTEYNNNQHIATE